MGNPSHRDKSCTCFTCGAHGGPHERLSWAVYCRDPKASGKEVSQIPEVGCSAWRGKSSVELPAAQSPMP